MASNPRKILLSLELLIVVVQQVSHCNEVKINSIDINNVLINTHLYLSSNDVKMSRVVVIQQVSHYSINSIDIYNVSGGVRS